MLTTRSKYLNQLEEIDATLGRFSDETAADIRALAQALSGDAAAAQDVLDRAVSGRRLRGTIEETCLDAMLLQQPVAGDLRFLTGTFRLVSDLAHIDAKANDVAELAQALPADVTAKLGDHLRFAADHVATMVEEAVEAFRTSDVDRAHGVFAMDDDIDDVYLAAEGVVIDLIKASETRAKYLPELLMVAKYFERMGDDAVRIADWAIFRAMGARERAVETGEAAAQ
ncbi:phosphate signaling complex PhoU family protein [Enorma burkinafasonensis]|uniref:phosphate signaling complex PhoU family protein n=1 Tax=Enorma burkinafasonensis TaxID=2590867 RepID=UPI0011A9F326|nr:phosphate uptake regulator PhoU [Enorma burkinafasonensis]